MGSNPIVSAIFSCKYLIYLIFLEALFPAPHPSPHGCSGRGVARSKLFPPIDVPGGALSGENPLAGRDSCPTLPGIIRLAIFRYFKTTPEIIRLAVVMDARYPLPLLNAEDLLYERDVGRWLNIRVENSHQPFRRRERAMLRFRRMRSLQKFAALHGSIHNRFNQERTLCSRQIFKDRRTAALTAWRQLCAA